MEEEERALRREVCELQRRVRRLQDVLHTRKLSQGKREVQLGRHPSVLEAIGAAWWEQDFTTGKVYRSPLWMRMLGYDPEEIPPELEAWKELIHPDDLPAALNMARLHERGETPVFEVLHRMRTKEGTWRWILNRGRIVERDQKGRPLRAVGAHFEVPAAGPVQGEDYRLHPVESSLLRLPDAFLAVCAGCKKVRDPQSEWLPIDLYLLERHHIHCTHGICPECATRLYPELSGAESRGGEETKGRPQYDSEHSS